MDEDIFEKKDKFNARASNKRVLSKKKRYQEKAEISKIEVPVEHFISESFNTSHWRIAEIRQ